jgi:hypothetical protein
MVVCELATAMLTAAVAWFHFDGHVAAGMQFRPVAGSANIDPDRSKTSRRSGGMRMVGLRVAPQLASMVGIGGAVSTEVPLPPAPASLLSPAPPAPVLLLAPPPVPANPPLRFCGGDQVHAPNNPVLPRTISLTSVRVRYMGGLSVSLWLLCSKEIRPQVPATDPFHGNFFSKTINGARRRRQRRINLQRRAVRFP